MVNRYASDYHVPILVAEVLQHLPVFETFRIIDCTLGGGGHSHAFLESNEKTHVIGIDRDPDARQAATERLAAFGDRLTILDGNYADAKSLAAAHAPVDAILIDAGVSSHQLDDRERGFSFRDDGPLDMRMSQSGETLEQYLTRVEEWELKRVLKTYGELPAAGRVARAILHQFEAGKIDGTRSLAAVIVAQNPMPRKSKINPATLAFQALRIAINGELDGLEQALQQAPDLLTIGGRIGVIAFHSLEDRIVKQRFKTLTTDSTPKNIPLTQDQLRIWGERVTRKPIVASDEEVSANPRARSAKFRVLKRVSEESCESF